MKVEVGEVGLKMDDEDEVVGVSGSEMREKGRWRCVGTLEAVASSARVSSSSCSSSLWTRERAPNREGESCISCREVVPRGEMGSYSFSST